MKTLDELMLKFGLCSPKYTRVLFMERQMKGDVSIASEYVRLRRKSIPSGVQVWEFDGENQQAKQIL